MQTTVIISGCASLEDNLAQLCRMLNQVQHDRWRVTLNSIQGLFHSSVSSGLNVLVTPHIYHLPEHDPIWSEMASVQGQIILVSPLYTRPAEWLFRKHWNGESLTALNIADYASAKECHTAILDLLTDETPSPGGEGWGEGDSLPGSPLSTLHSPLPLPDRWYPIIDRSRCKNCGNCLQFCLFGVYEIDGESVTVCKPDSCKPGCPACSRICPEGAIIFPLCEQSAAIAGAPGVMMSPDAAARRMFYARTKQTCPACGSGEDIRTHDTDGVKICEECGRPILSNTGNLAGSELRDELDQLIDDLDTLTRKD
jgi:NAD-dependent dihydropyrimidine dehydrogenase PreA subunit